MISIKDIYTVLVAMVPLYAAMILAYGSVRWWRIFTPVQCSGINRFVAVFAVPLLSFNFISKNNPYKMDFPFILADTISKLVIFLALLAWARFSRNGSLDWLITLFSLATLPNTLVMGIPLLEAMYGSMYSGLMVQLVVLQCIIWYTLMLFLFEYRAASLLVMQHFPDTAASIISFKIDSDVMSLDGREPVQTEADVGEDGKICVTIRRSISSRTQAFNCIASPRRSLGLTSMLSSKAITPRASNLTGADMYSIQSSRNQFPRDFNISTSELQSFMSTGAVSPRNSNFTSSDVYSVQSSRGPTPRVSNVYEDSYREIYAAARVLDSPCPQTPAFVSSGHPFNQKRQGGSGNALHDTHGLMQCGHGWNNYSGSNAGMNSPKNSLVSKNALDSRISTRLEDDSKGLHMYVWSSTDSPVSEAGLNVFGKGNFRRVEKYKGVNEHKEVKMLVVSPADQTPNGEPINEQLVPAEAISVSFTGEDFSSGNRKMFPEDTGSSMEKHSQGISKSSTVVQYLKDSSCSKPKELPPTMVMLKLILRMVGRKLLRNPNTYSSLIGLVWALVAFRWNISMPKIVIGSIKILSDAGLGMAMFSLGLFMALQPRLIACGTSLAVCAMAVRFLTGPAVMAASSIAVGLRGVDLHAAIVQAALPQGIVPFVFAREYDLHPDILSTAVIFGMLIALPITLLYYVLLGL